MLYFIVDFHLLIDCSGTARLHRQCM